MKPAVLLAQGQEACPSRLLEGRRDVLYMCSRGKRDALYICSKGRRDAFYMCSRVGVGGMLSTSAQGAEEMPLCRAAGYI
eukprot:1139657-Pelagomonas_calceolata.AAC.5